MERCSEIVPVQRKKGLSQMLEISRKKILFVGVMPMNNEGLGNDEGEHHVLTVCYGDNEMMCSLRESSLVVLYLYAASASALRRSEC